jgi:two-component system, NtrC family, response regulator AtoC
MTQDKILIVDNQQHVRRSLSTAVRNSGLIPIEAVNAITAVELFDLHQPFAVLININLPDGSGLDVLRRIKQLQAEAVVIVITDKAMVDETAAAQSAGAFEIISNPFNLKELQTLILKGLEARELRREVQQLHLEQINSFSFEQIIGESPAIKETIALGRKVAARDVSCVLLQGESGTGKDLFAKAIHFSSARAPKPFVAINCAAIPGNLLESELFGYEKGAFTDAKSLKEGLFEQAEGGTLFLNEISELEIGLQAKLLRVLEERTFRRVGGLRYLPLNVRVIAASNMNLRTESEAKRFRRDLYYRLSVIEINLPPLRSRETDVLLLAEHFIKALEKDLPHSRVKGISPEVEKVLLRYDWPGNVREFRNVIERALVLEEDEQITLKSMSDELLAYGSPNASHLDGELLKASRYVSLPADGISLDTVEMLLIQQALERSGGNATQAADLLHVTRDRIRYRLKKNKLAGNGRTGGNNGELIGS